MKSRKPEPTRPRYEGAARRPRASTTPRRTRLVRARASSLVALVVVALVAVVSSTSASRVASRGILEGAGPANGPRQSSVEAAGPRWDGAGVAGVPAAEAKGGADALKAGALFASPLFQLPAETVETFKADCATPQTTFRLGETVCARATNAVVGSSPFFGVLPLRKFSWINPAGFQVHATVINSATQTDTFTLPTEAAETFGDLTADNRGGWRVDISGLYEPLQRASAGFTVRDAARPAVDLSVLTTPEQREGGVPAGAQASFLIIVENRGPDAAANVELRNPVPDHTTFFALTQREGTPFACANPNAAAGPGGASVCTAASLPAGERAVFTAVYLVGGGTATGTEITDTASGTSATAERHQPDNTSSASYTVAEPSPCTITAPADVTVDNDAGQGGAVVNYGEAASAGCGPVVCDPPPNSFFPVGTTFVTCLEQTGPAPEDGAPAPTSSQIARFRVNVNDVEAPTISCPSNITVAESAPGSGSAVVNFSPTATDNGPVDVTTSPASGSAFSVGGSPHTVTATATDRGGNTATCTFNVTVTSNVCALDCPADITVNEDAPGSGSAAVSFPAPSASGGCGSVSYDRPSGSTFNLGTTTVTAADSATGASCSFRVNVTAAPDAEPPVINCPADIVQSAPANSCSASVAVAPPAATDNRPGVSVAGTRSDGAPLDAPFPVGETFINWTATDAAGNGATCEQSVRLTENTPPAVTAPAPRAVTVGASCEPVEVPNFAAGLAASDNCTPAAFLEITQSPAAETPVGVGSHAVNLTVTDASGNATTVTTTFNVVDNTPPTVAAPADVTASADPTACAVAGVALGAATAADNCAVSVTNDAPAVFPLGVTFVTWTATDAGGNTAADVQKVTVVDTTAPSIALAGANPLVVECHTAFADPGAAAADACDASVPVTASGAVDVNTPGTYTITYTAADDAGNSAAPVTRTVQVRDTTAPVISCPTDIVVTLPANSSATSMPVSFAVTAADSCDSAPTVALSRAPGSVFPVGTTVVNATAADDHGNTSSCSFRVTVRYNFSGFFSPVDNPPALNEVNGGRNIPIKFSLSGNKGLAIFAAGFPASRRVDCNTFAPLSGFEATNSPGGLSYGGNGYHYNWKTEKAWEGTCRQLVVGLNDGSAPAALFRFK